MFFVYLVMCTEERHWDAQEKGMRRELRERQNLLLDERAEQTEVYLCCVSSTSGSFYRTRIVFINWVPCFLEPQQFVVCTPVTFFFSPIYLFVAFGSKVAQKERSVKKKTARLSEAEQTLRGIRSSSSFDVFDDRVS